MTQPPTDFRNHAAYYRELAAREENDARANTLFEIANLFDRMVLDFAEYFPPQSHPSDWDADCVRIERIAPINLKEDDHVRRKPN